MKTKTDAREKSADFSLNILLKSKSVDSDPVRWNAVGSYGDKQVRISHGIIAWKEFSVRI